MPEHSHCQDEDGRGGLVKWQAGDGPEVYYEAFVTIE